MIELPLRPEGEEKLKREEDYKNYIEIPESISKVTKLKEYAKQWLDKYNFYFAEFDLSASKDTSAKGVDWLSISGRIGPYQKGINIDDKGPKTEWVDGKQKTSFNIQVDFNPVSKALKLINVPNVVSGGFNYSWQPVSKVGKIILQGAGSTIGWTFSADKDEYVDGSHEVFFIIRVPTDINQVFFEVTKAEARYHYGWYGDKLFYKGKPQQVPIKVS